MSQTTGSHFSMGSGESSKIVPTLMENCFRACLALHSQSLRVAMNRTSVRPQVGQTTPFGQRSATMNSRQVSGLSKWRTASRSVRGRRGAGCWVSMEGLYPMSAPESSILLPKLESIPSRKSHVVEAFLYASLLTLLASRALLLAVRRWGALGERRTPLERWARLFVSATPELLALVLDPAAMARTREHPLLRFFLAEAPDPNRKRCLLPERAGLKWAA